MKKTLIWIILISILAFLLRIFHLAGQSLWFDELMTYHRTRGDIVHVIENISRSPFPPLYYIFMKGWTFFFGSSEFFLRLPAAIFSALSVIFIFTLAKEMFDEKTGIFSAFLLSISPYSIYYAQEAKMYALLWALMILSFLFFYRFINKRNRSDLVLYVIFTVLSLYTMYTAILFMVVQNIIFFFIYEKKDRKKWLVGQLVVFLLYLPWIGNLIFNFYHRTGIGWIPETGNYLHLLSVIFVRTMAGLVPGASRVIDLSLYFFLIGYSFVHISGNKDRKYSLIYDKKDQILVLWVLVPLIIYLGINMFIFPVLSERTTRYIGFIHIPLIILISKGICKLGKRTMAAILISVLCLTATLRLYPFYQYTFKVLHYDNWRDLSAEMRNRAGNDSIILTGLPVNVVSYYLDDIEIRSMEYLNIINNKEDKVPGDIFIVYWARKDDPDAIVKKDIKGYRFIENYSENAGGFLWFKRSDLKD